ncbi:hypothetical protein OEZ85_012795 [Tetradesmus obliquus]|uniref:GRIP domain-containing protein n=1 Tax=Tetradesmus obliquus TaxID=3088 RepID=A0ABY8U4D3_TETOB|nr:hypothetical protein OEZ85_012795 [Tetradesmus obliquus]
MPPTSPRAEAIAKLRSKVESRLNQTHEDRIQQLAARLQSSLQSPFDKAGPVQALSSSQHAQRSDGGAGQVRLAEVFDELLASDQAHRMAQLKEEVTFREREVYRLTEALEQSQLEASLAKQQQQTTDAQLVKASTSAALLETELRRLQQDHEALAQQVSSLTAGKASADRAAAVGETRAATAEALLSSKSQELEQLQVHYKRLLTEQQAELERLRQQLHSQSAEQTKAASAAATREQDLLRELQAVNSSMVELKTGLAAERSSGELLQAKVTELTSELEAAQQGKQQLAANLKQVEGLLSDSEAERRTLRAKYMNLGDKLQGMLADEAAQQKAAAAEAAALQQQLTQAQQGAAASQQQLEQTVAQLLEAQQALVDADRLHSKAMRKLDKKMVQLAQEHDVSRQELLIKSAEILDLQAQLKEAAGQHDMQLAAAQEQADLLQGQIAQLQQQLQLAAVREQQVQQEAVAAAQDRLEIELRQQQLKYERQIQELELHNRYIAALDVLSNPHPAAAARQALDHAAAAMHEAAYQPGNSSGGAGMSSGGASMDLPPASSSRLDVFDARLRRTLAEHVSRNEAAEAMEHKLLAVKRELSADYKRRLDALEAEWAARSQSRTQELESTHALKLQQVELSARLEKERLDARLAEIIAAKQRCDEQLGQVQQELSCVTREASQQRLAAEEGRLAKAALQSQLDEASAHVRQLQALLGQYSSGGKGEREVVADLMSRLEQRTAERNEAMQAAATAEAKAKALESEKVPWQQLTQQQQRQLQQAAEAAEAARAAAEARLKQVMAEATEASDAATAAQASHSRQVKRMQEEKVKLEENLEELKSAREALDKQLSLSQAEARSLARQLRETSQQLSLLQEDHAAAEAVLARLKDERQQLLVANAELDAARAQLSSQAAVSGEEQRRLSLMVQGLEMHKAGLQRRLSVVEAEKQVAMRTSELRASSPSFMAASPRASLRLSTAASGGGEEAGLGSPYAAAAAAGSGGGAGAGSLPSSPLARDGAGGSGSFAFARRGSCYRATSDGMDGFGSPSQASAYMQDLDGLLAQFDDERRAMMERYEALDAEAVALRQQLSAATLRCSELSMQNEQLLRSLERHKGALALESKAASELADKVLGDVQRSSNDMAQLNSWLQSELDAARKSHKEALEAASAAEKKALLLEVKVSELQHSAAAAAKEAASSAALSLHKLQAAATSSMAGLRSQLAQLQGEVKGQLTQLAQQEEAALLQAAARHEKQLQEQQAAAAAASDAAAAKHKQQLEQMQTTLEEQGAAAAAQSLVATVAFSIPVGDEVQQGLNSRDAAVFDEQLAALHEAIKVHVESEKALLADSINSGPVAELQGRLHEAEARLAEAAGTITQMRHERQEDAARFEEGLVRARNEAADGAEVARKESLAGLKAELAAMKAQLSQLQEVHAAELASLQESSAKALASHVKAADGCIKELEATALGLQGQLAAEVERADAYSKELRRLQAEKERVLALEARKERRQTGEIEGLRERLRGMEAREREQEDELKALKRSLRAKELSLLSSAATSMADR